MNLGRVIRRGREKNGLTRKYLAMEFEVTVGTISNWENNIRIPSATDFIKLAKMLDIVSDIFPQYEKKQEDPDKFTEIVRSNVKPKPETDKYTIASLATNNEILTKRVDKVEAEIRAIKKIMDNT